jgi:hypothetical protein
MVSLAKERRYVGVQELWSVRLTVRVFFFYVQVTDWRFALVDVF